MNPIASQDRASRLSRRDVQTRLRRPLLGAVLAATAFAAAACGGSAGAGAVGDGASTPDAGIDVEQAKEDLAAIVGESDLITLPPIDKEIPTGKTISYMTCPLAVCGSVGEGVQQAAQALGWNVRVIPNNLTPAGYTNAWDQVAQNPGDAVINAAPILPRAAVAAQMEKAKVPVVSSTSPDPVGGQLIAVVAGSDNIKRHGALNAYWVVSDAEQPVKSVFVYDPSIASVASALPGYQEAMEKNCSACTVDVLKVSAAQIGPALAQQVVSYLQSNPDVKYAVFGLGDLATGVPAAIEAAGLTDKVKLTTRAATPTNLQDVKNGGMTTAFTSELYESGWRAVDKLARTFTGTPIGEPYPIGLSRQITKENLPDDLTVPYSIPDYETGFKKAWNVQ